MSTMTNISNTSVPCKKGKKATRYAIKGDAVIFDSSIDEPIDEYFEVIGSHPILAFNDKSFKSTKRFNQPNLLLGQNIKKLVLNPHYNQPLKLPKYIKCLKINLSYDNPILLPKTIVYFDSEYSFLENIKLSKNIKHVFTPFEFNQIIKLSKSTTHLKCNPFFNLHLDVSKNMIYLRLGNKFNRPIVFPKKLKYLIIGLKMCYNFILPKCAKHMMLDSLYINRIVELTETIEKLTLCRANYGLCENLTDSLKCVFVKKDLIKNNIPVKPKIIIKRYLHKTLRKYRT